MSSRSAVIRITVALAALAASLSPEHAFAGGLEYTAAGATALGRGGAVAARADDPMVLYYNPAGLAELRGSQLLFDANLALMNACVEPIGYYGWGAYGGGGTSRLTNEKGEVEELRLRQQLGPDEQAYYNDPLDTVCLDQNIVPIPQLAATFRLTERLGIGLGLIFPSVMPSGQWGDDNGMVRGDTGNIRPAATRYQQMNTGTFGIFPTFGLGYRVTDWLRVGGAVEVGMVWIDFSTMAVATAGTSPHNDVKAHLTAKDLFIPAGTVSVHLVPMDSLDIVAAFRYQDAIKASGTIDLTLGEYGLDAVPVVNNDMKVTHFQQNMPWKLRAGVRYSDRLAPRPEGTGNGEGGAYGAPVVRDAFSDERWDVELDVEYQMNSKNQRQRLEYAQNQVLRSLNVDGVEGVAGFPEANQPYTNVEKRWKDQLSLRAGGSYNLIPGLFGVSAGAHYENRGLDPAYMQIDYWPVSRFGVHAGIKFRIFGGTDLVFSYAHIFQETLIIGAPPHRPASEIDAGFVADRDAPITAIDKSSGYAATRSDPPPPVLHEVGPKKVDAEARLRQVTTRTVNGEPPYIINSGKYISDIDVFAIGVHAHF